MRALPCTALLGLAALLGTALPASAQLVPNPTVIGEGEVDLDINYDGGWEFSAHYEDTDTEYEPDTVLLAVNPGALTPRFAGGAFDFIGVGEGQPIYVLPAVQNPELLYLGIATEELSGATFDPDFDANADSGGRVPFTGRYVRFSLTDVDGPGDFSVWRDDLSGPTAFMASADGITGNDAVWSLEGGHDHYNYAFTAPGSYAITFTASGYLDNGAAGLDPDLFTSASATYFFQVVPEPSGAALGAAGGLAVAGGLLRRRALRR